MAAESDSYVGMASTRRVTVSESRTRPGPQTRAVDLWNAVEIDDYFTAAALHDGLERFVKLLGGFADGEPSVDFQQINAVLLPNGNLHRYVLGH